MSHVDAKLLFKIIMGDGEKKKLIFFSRRLFFLMPYVLSQRFTCRVDGFVVGRDVPHISAPNIRRKRELSFP